MRSTSQAGSNDHSDHTKPDNPTTIPDFASAWESASQVVSSVRRPSTLPDPESYHKAIDPQAIFELDERQDDGSIETILVVAFSCQRCRYGIRQACSRARPVCARCRNAQGAERCETSQGGYQRLPGPKITKNRVSKPTNGTGEKSTAPSSFTQESSAARRFHARRTASRMVPSWLLFSSDSESSVTPGSKRPLSPGSASVPPRKRTQAKTISRKRNARRVAAAQEDMDVDQSDASSTQGVSARPRGVLKWTFVKGDKKPSSQEQERARPLPSNTRIPRVWTNSLGGLLTIFPELGKSEIGFSWFQSETPVLLLDTRGRWINSTTLTFDLLWDFTCDDSRLEPVVELETGEQSLQPPPVVYSPTDTLDCEPKMCSHDSHSPSKIGSFSANETVFAPLPASGTGILPLDGVPEDNYTSTHESYAGSTSLMYPAIQDDLPSAIRPTQVYSSDPSSLNSQPSQSCPIPNELPTQDTIPESNVQPRIPLDKPPEVETLLNSHLRLIPLLLWISRDSRLALGNLPPEYAYLCMGLFFISDLRLGVVQHCVSSMGRVEGQVCWTVTLQWAPGGEDALFDHDSVPLSNTADSGPVDATRDLSRPWWVDPTNASSQANDTTLYRPRDLRKQFFSFIPLNFLAEFHPSESFPRGWFCKLCGMSNVQIYFRHQLCQSTTCRSTRDKRIPPGKVDPLRSLRDLYQSSTIIRPTSDIPSAVVSESVTWDDGMRSWMHNVKNGVTLCHIFTGNQEYLQTDATALLEAIQSEVPLRKEEYASPYFIYHTKISHPSDGSETTVPRGTPNCVRTAYYTLCDFVHRYAGMDKPRLGEVRLQAWVSSGSKKGSMFHASKSLVVVHCLGADVVLKFTPKGGYEDAAKPSAPDKGKGRAKDQDRAGSQFPKSCAGPSRHLEQDYENVDQTPVIPGLEANETPAVAENVDEDINTAMDTVHQYNSSHDAGTAKPDSNANRGTEAAQQEVIGRCVRKKNKVTNDKTKSSVPGISMTLVHGDCVVLSGDDFEYQLVRTGTTILVIGFSEETR